MMSIKLTDIYVGKKTVCMSTEELSAEVDQINEEGIIENTFLVSSMDVETLYPSMDIEFTVDKVCELLYESDIEIEGIYYKELRRDEL